MQEPPRTKQKTPPSPPVIKTKTGFWQVTTADFKPNGNENHNKTPRTATVTSISPTNFYSNKFNNNCKDKKINTNKWNESNNGGDPKGTVNHLLKFSHRGYGAPVLSWNGHKADMEKEVMEENRLKRKNELYNYEENDMDRGRQKKIKQHVPLGRDNPGYNPFQEYQNQQYQQNRRWNNNNNGHLNGRPFHQNHMYRQNFFYRNQNNFRRNRFHQRPNHQRNGNHAFHYRRES